MAKSSMAPGSASFRLSGLQDRAAASDLVFIATTVMLVASIALGGGTHSGYLGDVVLQLASLFLIVIAIQDIIATGSTRRLFRPLLFVVLLCLVPAAQLVPLPHAIWQYLPGREVITETYKLLDKNEPSLPLSMAPFDTWLSGLAFLPALSIFLGCLTLDLEKRRTLSIVIIAIAVVSLFLGLLQLAQGPNSPLRFYDFTNTGDAVGFFANRNHFAALLYCAMIFTAMWLVDATLKLRTALAQKDIETRAISIFLVCLTAFVALLIAQLMARSRAGLGLSLLSLFGAVALGMRDRRALGAGASTAKVVVAAVVITLVLSIQFVFYRVIERFGADPLADARVPFAQNTMTAAKAYMPFGSGLGTFVPVYQMFEKPSDIFPAFANHAHNDILEVWLETGIVGLLFMGVFLVWLLGRGYAVWRNDRDIANADLALMRAASLVLLLLALHSFVDYPLRTSAMMAIAAYACAILIRPAENGATAARSVDDAFEPEIPPANAPAFSRQHAQEIARVSEEIARARDAMARTPENVTRPGESFARPPLGSERPVNPNAQKQKQLWGQSIDWPDSWRQQDKPAKDPRGPRKE